MKLFQLTLLLCFFMNASAQDWWTKTRTEAIPADLKETKLLVEKFKTVKPESAPAQAYLNPKKVGTPHPLLKKTNDQRDDYNTQLKTIFKKYKWDYKVCSKKKGEDLEYYPADTAKYVLRHEVYLRKYQEAGNTTHFYTYVFYFRDRASGKDYPHIYLFDKKRLMALDKLVGYLNKL